MAIASVDEAFKELLRRIELNPARVDLASQRYNAVKQSIETALPGKTVRQIGSFQRKTKIRPADLGDRLDIDVVVSFGSFYHYAPAGNQGISPAVPRQNLIRTKNGLIASLPLRTFRTLGSQRET